MIGADDWGVFFDASPGGVAEPVRFRGAGHLALDRSGIFSDSHITAAVDDFGGGVSTVSPMLSIPADHLPGWLEPDASTVEVRRVAYIVRDVRPDGTGLARLILERA